MRRGSETSRAKTTLGLTALPLLRGQRRRQEQEEEEEESAAEHRVPVYVPAL